MSEKTVYASRILEAVHEGAKDLFAGGFIDAAEMKLYDEDHWYEYKKEKNVQE